MQRQAARAALLLFVCACSAAQVWSQAVSTRAEEGTLVVYSYRQSDPEALGNFQYFLDNVLSPRDPARYIVVVDHNSPQQRGHMSLAGLPRLPTNAQYLSIRDCYELGHVGKVLLGLKSKHVSTEKYDYFVWLDSSVKRSVFPTADAQGKHAAPWHTQLTARISSTTKLIGASISCEAASPQQVSLLLTCVLQLSTLSISGIGRLFESTFHHATLCCRMSQCQCWYLHFMCCCIWSDAAPCQMQQTWQEQERCACELLSSVVLQLTMVNTAWRVVL